MITFAPSTVLTHESVRRAAEALISSTLAAREVAATNLTTAHAVYTEDHNVDSAGVAGLMTAEWISLDEAYNHIRTVVLPVVGEILADRTATSGNLYHAQRMVERGQDALTAATRRPW